MGWSKAYIWTGIDIPTLVEGLTTQKPNLIVMVVVMVVLKREQTILVGCWSVELPGYTLQSIEEMLL